MPKSFGCLCGCVDLFDKKPPEETCTFCSILRGRIQTTIVYEDDEFIAFNDISPSAKDHFLVIPRQHIETIYSLNSSHISLVTRMRDIGHHLLDQRAYSLFDRRLGFHVPPFTSVPHIHLHVMGLPWKNSYRAIKYPDSWAWARWWIGIEHVVESLKVAEERDEEGRWKWSWVNHK